MLSECWTIILLKELTILKPDGRRKVERPKLRWMDGTDDELGMLSVRGWRQEGMAKCPGCGQGPSWAVELLTVVFSKLSKFFKFDF
jgi:hypothetical protein